MLDRYSSSAIMWSLDNAPLRPEHNGQWVQYEDVQKLLIQANEKAIRLETELVRAQKGLPQVFDGQQITQVTTSDKWLIGKLTRVLAECSKHVHPGTDLADSIQEVRSLVRKRAGI